MTELTTKSSGSHFSFLKTILVIGIFFLVITGITEAQILSEVKINNGETGGNYSGESYNYNQSWNWTYNGYANQTDTEGAAGVVYVVAGGGGGGGSLYNNAAENASTVVTPAVTSQVGGTPVDAWNASDAPTKANLDVMAVVAIGLGVLFIMVRLRPLSTGNDETPHHSSTPPQTVASNTPHGITYVGGEGGNGSGGGHTPHYSHTPSRNTSPVGYKLPESKKPIVDRDGVEDDDSSFIEVLD
jgi:hypothetical protein